MQALIERGHPPQEVERYTVAKLWWYLGAVARGNERERLAYERAREQGQ